MMIIDCIADLHGHYPKLEGGDLLIVAGDMTASDSHIEHYKFYNWLEEQKYSKIIVIAGNHDNYWYQCYEVGVIPFGGKDIQYLCDSGTEFDYYPPLEKDTPAGTILERKTYKIWGSPWAKRFEGMNPKCMAFTVDTDEQLAEKWAMIPEDVDILVTHCPPKGMLDKTARGEEIGSQSLTNKIHKMQPLAHVFGHIHESYGKENCFIPASKYIGMVDCVFINASHVNEHYEPVNKPIRIEL